MNKIYSVIRSGEGPDSPDMDEFSGFVVIASNPDRARAVAREHAWRQDEWHGGDRNSNHRRWDNADCVYLGDAAPRSRSRVVLADFWEA